MNFLFLPKIARHFNAFSLQKISQTKSILLFSSFCKAKHNIPALAFILLLINSLSAFGQVSEEWVARYNGPDNERDAAYHMVMDDEGNIYVSGASGIYDHNGNWRYDYVTVKYNAEGEEQWVVRYNGPGNSHDIPAAMAVDAEGNVYVTGSSMGLKSDYNHIENYDYATVKYNNKGEEQWVVRHDGPENARDVPAAIAVDAEGNVFVTGASSVRSRYPHTKYYYCTIKYDASGEEQWVAWYKGYNQNAESVPRAMAMDSKGNIYVTGHSRSEMGLGNDYVTIKYNTSGEEQWIRRYEGTHMDGYDEPSAMAVDAGGNVYVTGYSGYLTDIVFDYATVKYNSLGEEEWVGIYKANAPYSGDATPQPIKVPPSIAISESGDVYIAGATYENETEMDFTTIRYSALGKEQWVKKYNGSASSNGEARDLAIGADGGIYVTGFDDGKASNNDITTLKYNASGEEQLVVRYNGPGNGSDVGHVIKVDDEGNIFVSGHSSGEGSGADFTVIKYKHELGVVVPVELSAEGVSDSQINLSWQSSAEDLDGFVLERATNRDFTGSVAYIRLAADRTSYEDKNKATDVTFYYRIKAVKGEASSEYSAVVSATATETTSNQPPVVDAGEDQTISLPADSVSFTATASDPDGEIVSYLWEQLEGPSVTLSGADSNTLLVTELEEGSYTFEVQVTDDKENTASDQVKLIVNPESGENVAPVAHAGEDQTVAAGSDGTASVTLDGSGSSDPDGSINRYVWSKEGEEFMKGVTPTVSLPVGIHTITLTVYDNEWVSDTDEVVITVNAAPDFAAPSNLTARSVSDSQINLSWQDYAAEEEGFVLERATNSHFTGSVAYIKLPAGRTSYEDGNKATDVTFYYRLKAIKGDDASPYSNIASATAGSTPDLTGPVADAGKDQTVTAGEDGMASVSLDGSASSVAEGSIVDYRWTLAGEEIATGVSPTVSLATGTHTITLTVTDNEGATDSDEVTITVQDAEAELAAPAHLSAEGVSASQINLSWKNHALEHDGFVLERATNPDFTGSVAYISIPANTTSYEDRNKTTDVTFYYRVKAVKGSISSDYSNIVSAAATHSAGSSMRIAGSASENMEGITEASLQVYPNPLQQEFTVKLHNDYEGPVRLVLFDVTGRIFMEESFEKTSGEHAEKLQISGLSLPHGVYFLKLSGEGMDEGTIRLVKE
jgi:uncharacterized delta-60 repeat protein